MDQPSGSNMRASTEDLNADVPEMIKIARKIARSNKNNQNFCGSKIKINNQNYLAKNLRSLVAECETRIRSFVKRQRSEQSAEIADYDLLNSDDKSSSDSSSGVEDTDMDDVEELQEYVTQPSLMRLIKREKLTMGHWLFLSFVQGGWSFENVKNFLLKEYGVTCLRNKTKTDRVSSEEYKAIVKFKTSEELNRVVIDLSDRKMNDKFVFLSFDKELIFNNDSDWSDDDSRY
ncbi:unnamed protein product [Euphydryas editha]|uniref:Uncharacterized protein n=1 Tax=Euphydryas editha TaxID=104508 RepID=A0AAU9UVK6_EUPED|nr:unnamed protein product [Euphydryas editha]